MQSHWLEIKPLNKRRPFDRLSAMALVGVAAAATLAGEAVSGANLT
jgi:hypothetical protein